MLKRTLTYGEFKSYSNRIGYIIKHSIYNCHDGVGIFRHNQRWAFVYRTNDNDDDVETVTMKNPRRKERRYIEEYTVGLLMHIDNDKSKSEVYKNVR